MGFMFGVYSFTLLRALVVLVLAFRVSDFCYKKNSAQTFPVPKFCHPQSDPDGVYFDLREKFLNRWITTAS